MASIFDQIKMPRKILQQVEGSRGEPSTYKYLVNGEWRESESGKTIEVVSPVDGSVVGKTQAITQKEVDEIVASAKRAQKEWAQKPQWERSKIAHQAARLIEENKEVLTDLLVLEIGKPKKQSKDEVERTVELVDYYAEEAQRTHGELVTSDAYPGFKKTKYALIERVPLGVVLAIPPFNYPINETAPKILGGLLTGNSVILKPPSQGAISAIHLAACFAFAGLPEGVLSVASGRGSEIGDYLTTHKDIAAINFTGSTETGEHIAKIAPLKKLVMGLSGKDASIVLSDADLDLAVSEIANGAFAYSGQRCTGIKRVLVEEKVAEEFEHKLCSIVQEKFVLGDPMKPETTLGPVISEKVATFVQGLIEEAVQKGARVLLGYDPTSSHFAEGFAGLRGVNLMMPATILTNVSQETRVAWEEPFGPVLPVIRVKNWEEAVEIANKSEYGLQSSVFTRNFDLAVKIAGLLEVGTVQINAKDARGPDHFPFMGVKKSGIGMAQGARYLLQEMTRIKTTVLNFKF